MNIFVSILRLSLIFHLARSECAGPITDTAIPWCEDRNGLCCICDPQYAECSACVSTTCESTTSFPVPEPVIDLETTETSSETTQIALETTQISSETTQSLTGTTLSGEPCICPTKSASSSSSSGKSKSKSESKDSDSSASRGSKGAGSKSKSDDNVRRLKGSKSASPSGKSASKSGSKSADSPTTTLVTTSDVDDICICDDNDDSSSSSRSSSKGKSNDKPEGSGYGDCDCKGGVLEIRYIYQGSVDDVSIDLFDKSGSLLCTFANIDIGEEIICNLLGSGKDKFDTETPFVITRFDGSTCSAQYHTSCSQDIVGVVQDECPDLIVSGWIDNDGGDCDDEEIVLAVDDTGADVVDIVDAIDVAANLEANNGEIHEAGDMFTNGAMEWMVMYSLMFVFVASLLNV